MVCHKDPEVIELLNSKTRSGLHKLGWTLDVSKKTQNAQESTCLLTSSGCPVVKFCTRNRVCSKIVQKFHAWVAFEGGWQSWIWPLLNWDKLITEKANKLSVRTPFTGEEVITCNHLHFSLVLSLFRMACFPLLGIASSSSCPSDLGSKYDDSWSEMLLWWMGWWTRWNQ